MWFLLIPWIWIICVRSSRHSPLTVYVVYTGITLVHHNLLSVDFQVQCIDRYSVSTSLYHCLWSVGESSLIAIVTHYSWMTRPLATNEPFCPIHSVTMATQNIHIARQERQNRTVNGLVTGRPRWLKSIDILPTFPVIDSIKHPSLHEPLHYYDL